MNDSKIRMVTRRASLALLGGLGAARFTAGDPVETASKGSARKKSRQRCRTDTAACLETLRKACEADPSCVGEFSPCCETCSANGFFTCYLDRTQVVK